MAWTAAGFLFLIYCIISVMRRKFGVPLTVNLWVVLMLSVLIGGLLLVIPRIYAVHANDDRVDSALYITNSLGIGIGVCGPLLGLIAQSAHEWGEAQRAKKQDRVKLEG